MNSFSISGQLIDVPGKRIYPALVEVREGRIACIQEQLSAPDQYILPGFTDAHVHIESSMLVPTEFARLAAVHGTVATVSDPHEIANVCGAEGVQYMIDNSKRTPFKFFFGAPSCVPATGFETAGAVLDAKAIEKMLESEDIWYLAEMMNYPGVLYNDGEVMAKIAAAKKAGKPLDGHAPGLRGETAAAYAAAGITTDHECFTLEEALDKIAAGMHIIIREGSAARNFEALHELITTHPGRVMFCSDDKHPDELLVSHINAVVKRALAKGHGLFDVLGAACINPILHYRLPVGLLGVNDPADFIVIDNLEHFNILKTYTGGVLVAQSGKPLLPRVDVPLINNFDTEKKTEAELAIRATGTNPTIRVIEAVEGQLVTNELQLPGKVENGQLVSDTENDILKLVIVNRYQPDAPVAKAFIKNIGIKRGALASTVAHDCHNIVAVGVDDTSMVAAINALIEAKGGISVAGDNDVQCMPLPVGGLMSAGDGAEVAVQYSVLDARAKDLGTPLKAPFMTLSFMALLVIPALKLSDKGLFDGSKFQFTNVEV